jgi:protein-L-isoaspartate(D-aspartate) O-methyltransferase
MPGDRVLHIGCGSGYYTAILASMVGPGGHVTAIDVDPALAAAAATHLADWPWVSVRQGDGTQDLPEAIEVVVKVGAGR